MSCLSKFDVGGCGCSGGGGGDGPCGVRCSVCGGRKLISGTITDAQGTHELHPWPVGPAPFWPYLATDSIPFTWTSTSPPGTWTSYYRLIVACSEVDVVRVMVEVCYDYYLPVYTLPPPVVHIGPDCWCDAPPPFTPGIYYYSAWAGLGSIDHAVTSGECSGDLLAFADAFSGLAFNPLGGFGDTGIPIPVTDIAVEIPLESANCCQQFRVTGCGGLNLAGAHVQVYDHAGGTLLAEGTTGASGSVWLVWPASCDVYVVVVKCLFADYGASRSLSAGGTTTIGLTALTPANCVDGHADPQVTVTLAVYQCDHVTPCPDATVTFRGIEYSTDLDGQVELTGFPGEAYTVQGCGSELYHGAIDDCGEDQDVFLSCETCIVSVTVTGCNGLPLPGASVEAVMTPLGTIATCETDEDGHCTLEVPSGTMTIGVTCARFEPSYEEVTYSCPAAPSHNVALTPASGYHCLDDGVMPLADATEMDDADYGTTAMAYDGGSGTWKGSKTATWPGNGCCPSKLFTIAYTFYPDRTLVVQYGRSFSVTYYTCPEGNLIPHAIDNPALDVEIVPVGCLLSPSFYFVWLAASTPCVVPPGDDSPYDMLYPSGGTLTMTEA